MDMQLFKNLLTEPEGIDRPKSFLQAVLALGIICTLQGDEKQHSARWNRTRSAEESILRVCDIYLPDGMDKARLASIWDVLDGPVSAVIQRHAGILMDALQHELAQ